MGIVGGISRSDAVSELVQWWADAGVDGVYAEDFGSWLDADSPPDTDLLDSHTAPRTVPAAQPAVAAPVAGTRVERTTAPTDFPKSLGELCAQLATADTLPGTGYGEERLLPQGNADAPLMLVTDFPAAEDFHAGHYFAGSSGAMLDSMLAAIGLSRESCYILPLAVTRPPSGSITESDLPALAALARHHLALCTGSHVLTLGNAASLALFGESLADARGALREFNHSGSIKAGVTTFHPTMLIGRSSLKAECWRDLQLLAKENIL